MNSDFTCHLLLGGNQGNPKSNFEKSIEFIEKKIGIVVSSSSLYQTAAWGKEDQAPFLNQVLKVSTKLGPEILLKEILEIESLVGRVRYEKWGPRIIDIDILFYENAIIEEKDLTIPHPYLHQRAFTLIPLEEIAPELMHPVFNKTISELLTSCEDTLPVSRID